MGFKLRGCGLSIMIIFKFTRTFELSPEISSDFLSYVVDDGHSIDGEDVAFVRRPMMISMPVALPLLTTSHGLNFGPAVPVSGLHIRTP
jgi:hypothetical protein